MGSIPFERVMRVLVLDTEVVKALTKPQSDLQKAQLDPVVSLGCIVPTGQVVLFATATQSITVWTSVKQLAEVLANAPNLSLCIDAPLLLQEVGGNALVC